MTTTTDPRNIAHESQPPAPPRRPDDLTLLTVGHANVDTTLNVYTQVLDGSVREAVEKVGGELFTIVHSRTAANEQSE
jgi:hypothetical protein